MGELKDIARRDIHFAAELMRSNHHTVVLTGAGFSTPSGIPDFRSPGSGLWNRYDPFEVASLSAFRYHPEKFFDWMRKLALTMVQAAPNPAHFALAQMEKSGYIEAIITQNIDGLHTRAGANHVLEVHGSLRTLTCIGCYRQYEASSFMKAYLEDGEIPHCPDCHHILKPDVVLFEEQLPVRTWLKAQQASRNCDLMLVAGSSLEVMPVAGLPMEAIRNGASVIVINQSPTYIDDRAAVLIHGNVAEVMPELAAEVTHE